MSHGAAPPFSVFGAFDARGRPEAVEARFARMERSARLRGMSVISARLGGAGRGGVAIVGAAAPVGPDEPWLARIQAEDGRGVDVAGDARLFGRACAPGDDLAAIGSFAEAGGFQDLAEGVSPVEGEIAVAVIDAARGRLILACDALGLLEVHHCDLGGGAAGFSTTPHELLALEEGPSVPDIDPVRWAALGLSPPARRGFWRGIRRVSGGHSAIYDATGLTERRWWRPGPDPRIAALGDEDALEAFRDSLDEAVTSRWDRAAGGRAVVFSGGLDSSMIAGRIAERRPEAPLPLYSMASRHPSGREDARVRRTVVERLEQARPTELASDDLDPLDGAESAWLRFAGPNTDLVTTGSLAIARRMQADGLDGGLHGMGGDFAASAWSGPLLAEALRAMAPARAARVYAALRRSGMGRRLLLTGWAASVFGATRWASRLMWDGAAPPAPFRAPTTHEQARWNADGAAPQRRFQGSMREARLDAVGGAYRFDRTRFLVPDLQGGAPRMMRFSHPLLDTRVIAASLAAPRSLELHDGRDRGLARATLARMGLDVASHRGAKGHFAADMWDRAGPALAARRATFHDFQDLPTWREHVDQVWLTRALDGIERTSDRTRLAAVLRAWFFGEFLRLSSEAPRV